MSRFSVMSDHRESLKRGFVCELDFDRFVSTVNSPSWRTKQTKEKRKRRESYTVKDRKIEKKSGKMRKKEKNKEKKHKL